MKKVEKLIPFVMLYELGKAESDRVAPQKAAPEASGTATKPRSVPYEQYAQNWDLAFRGESETVH